MGLAVYAPLDLKSLRPSSLGGIHGVVQGNVAIGPGAWQVGPGQHTTDHTPFNWLPMLWIGCPGHGRQWTEAGGK